MPRDAREFPSQNRQTGCWVSVPLIGELPSGYGPTASLKQTVAGPIYDLLLIGGVEDSLQSSQ